MSLDLWSLATIGTQESVQSVVNKLTQPKFVKFVQFVVKKILTKIELLFHIVEKNFFSLELARFACKELLLISFQKKY